MLIFRADMMPMQTPSPSAMVDETLSRDPLTAEAWIQRRINYLPSSVASEDKGSVAREQLVGHLDQLQEIMSRLQALSCRMALDRQAEIPSWPGPGPNWLVSGIPVPCPQALNTDAEDILEPEEWEWQWRLVHIPLNKVSGRETRSPRDDQRLLDLSSVPQSMIKPVLLRCAGLKEEDHAVLLDGSHRLELARRRGQDHVLALIGIPPELQPHPPLPSWPVGYPDIRVFGSASRTPGGDRVPGDIDLYVRTHSLEEAKIFQTALLHLGKRYFGAIDPFLDIPDPVTGRHRLWCLAPAYSGATLNGWVVAKQAAALRKAGQAGRPLNEFMPNYRMALRGPESTSMVVNGVIHAPPRAKGISP